MAIVATGQITIVDNNDAKPITAFIQINPGPQQVFTKDESAVSYVPNWQADTFGSLIGLQLTAKAYIGGVGSAVDITGQMSNRRWSLDLATPLVGNNTLISANAQLAAHFTTGANHAFWTTHDATGSTLRIRANLLPDVPQEVIYFEGDYTDPVTSLVSRVTASITLGLVKTGTNAVFLQTRGATVIEGATGTVKNVTAVGVDLIRQAGADTSGVTYRWYEDNGETQIINTGTFTPKYGIRSTTAFTSPVAALNQIGVGLGAAGAWVTGNTLVIHESAVTNLEIYKVEAKDSDGKIYQTFFTVYDVSDPYDCRILSSTGDKLQNGIGSSQLVPLMYYGGNPINDLTGWSFTWTFNNRNGKRGAFIDTTRTAVAGGRGITVNTTGVSAVFTYTGAPITFAAGDIIKAVLPNGQERFYEVASGTGSTVTIRTPTTNPWLTYANWPAPAVANEFVGGQLYVCNGNGGRAITTGSAALTITGDEIDAKAMILVEAEKPQ